jgi:hypothetical protein
LAAQAMTYWLGIETPEVWEAIGRRYRLRDLHTLAFPEGRRKSVEKMQTGDRIISYMIRPHSRFFAVWEITGRHHHQEDYLPGWRYPECVEVKPIVQRSPEKGVKNAWGVSVRQSAVRITEDVGDQILTALQRAE